MDTTHSFIVCPNVVVTKDGLLVEVDVDILRNQLVYWDRIEVLSHSHAPISADPHLDFLRDNRTLSYRKFILDFDISDGITENYDGPVDYPFRAFQARLAYEVVLRKALDMHRSKGESFISYGEPAWGLQIREKFQQRASTLQINLHNLLPKPSPNASFEDIIRFRQSRSDELIALRVALQKLLRDAQADPDSLRGEFLAVHELKRALRRIE